MAQHLLTVVGATGIQGGSVVKSVLAHPTLSKQFKIRAITRDASKPAAKALSEQGVEVVEADLNDKQSLIKAFTGSHTIFAVTNFWEKLSKTVEVEQGKNVADACKEIGNIQHLIWSSLANATEISGGKYTHVDHFDAKAEVEIYMRKLGLPVTVFIPAAYMSMIAQSLQKRDDGTFHYTQPFPITTELPHIDAAVDTGKFVAAIISHRDELLASPQNGGRVLGSSGMCQIADIIKALEKAGKTTVHYHEVTPEVYKSFLPPSIATEITEMMMFIKEFSYYGNRESAHKHVEASLKMLDTPPTTLEEFIEREKVI